MLRFVLTLFVGSENLCITTAPKPIRSVATCNVGNYLRDTSSIATCHVVSDPRDLSNMAIYHVRSTRNVNMPPHPTPPQPHPNPKTKSNTQKRSKTHVRFSSRRHKHGGLGWQRWLYSYSLSCSMLFWAGRGCCWMLLTWKMDTLYYEVSRRPGINFRRLWCLRKSSDQLNFCQPRMPKIGWREPLQEHPYMEVSNPWNYPQIIHFNHFIRIFHKASSYWRCPMAMALALIDVQRK